MKILKICLLSIFIIPAILGMAINVTQAKQMKYQKITPLVDLVYSDPLYNRYPCIGADDKSTYYIDTTSCYATTDGNIAKLSCIVLYTTKGSSELSSSTYVFNTFKEKKKRKIILESMAKNGKVELSNIDANKDDYLYALFWRIAGITNMNHFLD